jgi:hypothetical protein
LNALPDPYCLVGNPKIHHILKLGASGPACLCSLFDSIILSSYANTDDQIIAVKYPSVLALSLLALVK